MPDHPRSALLSLLCLSGVAIVSQLSKGFLAESQQGTLIGGGIGALFYLFTLSFISNTKLTLQGDHSASGLLDVIMALIAAAAIAATIHRVSVTVSILFSVILTVFLTSLSQNYYHTGVAAPLIQKKKK